MKYEAGVEVCRCEVPQTVSLLFFGLGFLMPQWRMLTRQFTMAFLVQVVWAKDVCFRLCIVRLVLAVFA